MCGHFNQACLHMFAYVHFLYIANDRSLMLKMHLGHLTTMSTILPSLVEITEGQSGSAVVGMAR